MPPIRNSSSSALFSLTESTVKQRISTKETSLTSETSTLEDFQEKHHLLQQLLHFPLRAAILFLLGALFSILVNHVLQQHHVTTFPNFKGTGVETAAWIPVWAGIGGVLVGSLHPILDFVNGNRHEIARDWANVMRCCGAFFGLAYAGGTLPWTGFALSISLGMQSIGMWYLFDRTRQGLAIGMLVAIIGTLVIRGLIYNDLLVFTQPDFWSMRSWVPIMLFSVSTCFGCIGRKLDIVPVDMWDDL